MYSKTTKLQDQQDHLFFQDQDRSGQDQDHFFKTAFFKDHQIINPTPQKTSHYSKKQASYAGIMQVTEKNCLLPAF